jgi:CheY-like chemotaxis protein
LLTDVMSLARIRAEAKGIRLSAKCIGALPEQIKTDPTRLRQILINLIGNAIKFTDHGSVAVHVSLVDPFFAPKLKFAVTDTGIGMNEGEIARLFQPFTQANESTTRRFGGTGLGLTICKRLVEMLSGTIAVESEPGIGSTFSFAIPIGPLDNVVCVPGEACADALNAANRAGTAGPPPKALEGRRILLAEDGPDNQRLIAFVLAKAGASVALAANGEEAVTAAIAADARGEPFDVILMDMQMPILDGYGATSQLRAVHYTRPIIALTANAMADDKAKCLSAGCDDFATKPIDRVRLIEQVTHFLNARESSPSVSASTAK